MFKNPGQKIKNLAISSFIIDCLSAIIGGIVLICNDYGWIGLVTLIGGLFVSYVIALLIYGFGELVENSGKPYEEEEKEYEIEKPNYTPAKTTTNSSNTTNMPKYTPIEIETMEKPKNTAAKTAGQITCPKCGASQFNNRKTCFSCGAELQ